MKVVIPMSGLGERFLAAGYTCPKPLIQVEGMPIIEHIVRNFSSEDHFVFGVNQDHLQTTPLGDVLKNIAPNSTLVSLSHQPEGVVSVLRELFDSIHDEEPVIVNYCDFSWVWNYEAFKREVSQTDCDGAVLCYRGFHPHLTGPNQYATLLSDGPWMVAIREKHSWHPDKKEDWTSSGTYYFKRGRDLKRYCTVIQDKPEWKIHGEYYVSQLFQLMKEDGLKILVYEIPYMLQWGTPEDLAQYDYWSNYFRKRGAVSPERSPDNMTVLILLAGAGKRFSQGGYSLPKPWIPVDRLPMVVQATHDLPRGNRYFFISRKDPDHLENEKVLATRFKPSRIIHIPELTEGQACTALCAKEHLDLELPLLIGACDHSVILDEHQFRQWTSPHSEVDALIFTFRHNPMVQRNPERYGWVQTDSSTRALRVSVKIPLSQNPSQDHAVVGAFWFKKARYFIDSAEEMIRQNDRVQGEFYIDQCMNYLIQRNLRVHVFEVEAYASWGTPDDLLTYEYWNQFFAQAPFHPYRKERPPQ